MTRPDQSSDASASGETCWSAVAHADRYDSDGNRGFYQSAMAMLLEAAPVLSGQGVDLGCGTGFSTQGLLCKYPEVTWHGVDRAAPMLARARKKPELARVRFWQASAESLPFPDRAIDLVVANFSWHWFGARAGHEVRRILRPGGWFLATVPLRLFSRASGNRLLARALLAARHLYGVASSRGLRFEATHSLLPGAVRVTRHELRIGHETFADGRAMLEVLDSRGALNAIFGAHPPAALASPSPLDFTWPFALVHLQVEG